MLGRATPGLRLFEINLKIFAPLSLVTKLCNINFERLRWSGSAANFLAFWAQKALCKVMTTNISGFISRAMFYLWPIFVLFASNAFPNSDNMMTVERIKREFKGLGRAVTFAPPASLPQRSAFEQFRQILFRMSDSIKGLNSSPMDPLQAWELRRELRLASLLVPGFAVPKVWWSGIWSSRALELEEMLAAAAGRAVLSGNLGKPLTDQEELRHVVELARVYISQVAIDWDLIDDVGQGQPALRLLAIVERRLQRALSTSPVDLLNVSESYSRVRLLRYLIPVRSSSEFTDMTTILMSEDLLAYALGYANRPTLKQPIESKAVELRIPFHCWSRSISQTSGEEAAKLDLAERCNEVTDELDDLRAGGGSLYQRFHLDRYSNISPWGKGYPNIPQVFDYLLTVGGFLELKISGSFSVTQEFGPTITGDLFEWNKDDVNASPNIASAFDSWFKKCREALWDLRKAHGDRWVAGVCGKPLFVNGSDYWKKSQVQSSISFWTKKSVKPQIRG